MQGANMQTQQAAASISEEEKVAGLLGGGGPEAAGADSAGGGEDESAGEVLKDGEGQEADEKPEGVNYKQLIPMADGEPVSLGKLKDFYQNQQAERLALIERETATMRQREQVETLLSYVENLPPEVREAATRRAAGDYERESRLLSESIPEFKTKEGSAAIKTSIYALTDSYGIPRAMVDGIKDHVTVKVLYDYARLKETIKAAKANVKPIRGSSPKGEGVGGKTGPSDLQKSIARARATRSDADETAAVNALFGVK